jgi:hypothetical protein
MSALIDTHTHTVGVLPRKRRILMDTQDSGRLSVPYVMLYYLPITCNSEVKMLYAGAKELMRNTSEVGRIIEIDSAEDLEEIEDKLKEQV